MLVICAYVWMCVRACVCVCDLESLHRVWWNSQMKWYSNMDLVQGKVQKKTILLQLCAIKIHYRFYIGCQPSILVSDLEMLKQIMIKNFDNFTDRSVLFCVCASTHVHPHIHACACIFTQMVLVVLLYS